MESIQIRIDEKAVEGYPGMTILEAAEKAEIHIPTLCHHKDLAPTGSCRICVVELEGSARLVGACHTPIAPGMVIHTRSPRVLRVRKAIVELLLAGHTGPCVTDPAASECELHKIAADLDVGPPRFSARKSRHYPVEDRNPYVQRDLSRCILCSRCIRACNDIAGRHVFSMAYRGFRSKVVVDMDVALEKDFCKDCFLCVEYCPTTALGKTHRPGDKKRGKDAPAGAPQRGIADLKRGNLLPMIQKAQDKYRRVPAKFMAGTAEDLNLSLSEVYGVASFYSFLSTKLQGKNVIRVCKSVPCYLKGAQMILESIEDCLGIKPGETTRDKKFSLELTGCIGACDQAPAMMVNQDVYGNLTPAKISRILKKY